MRPALFGLTCGGIALALDQLTKAAAMANAVALTAGLPILPSFNLVLVRNDGASFGLLGGLPPWLLVTLALAICVWLLATMLRATDRIEAAGCGLIIGGALGNMIDRMRHGAVTDFLDFYAGAWHWPAFNLADTFIFCGVAALLLGSGKGSRRRAPE